MPRIDEVIKDLWVAKVTFSRYYEKVMSKEMTVKTVTVSDANLIKIKKLLEKNWKLWKWNKKEETKPSALKSDELMWGGFLAWLWFERKVEEIDQEDDENEIIEDLTQEEEEEIQKYINNEFAPKVEVKIEKVEKYNVGVTKQDIISRSGRPAPKTIVYDKPRYDNKTNTWTYRNNTPWQWQRLRSNFVTTNVPSRPLVTQEINSVLRKPKIATTSENSS